MIMPMNPDVWQQSAEARTGCVIPLCNRKTARYRLFAGGCSSGFPLPTNRGKRCQKSNISLELLARCPSPHATQQSTTERSIGQLQVLRSVLSQQYLRMATSLRARWLAALLVHSPAKTDLFGNNCAPERLNSFISPLLRPLRVCGRGLFSCENAREENRKKKGPAPAMGRPDFVFCTFQLMWGALDGLSRVSHHFLGRRDHRVALATSVVRRTVFPATSELVPMRPRATDSDRQFQNRTTGSQRPFYLNNRQAVSHAQGRSLPDV